MDEQTKALMHNDEIIAHLRVLISCVDMLREVPSMVSQIIDGKMWQNRFIHDTGKQISYDDFKQFIEDPPLNGLGFDIELVKKLCEGTEAEQKLLSLLPTLSSNGTKHSTTATEEPSSRFSRDWIIARLEERRPDLAEQVKTGAMKANPAAIAAGLRKKRCQCILPIWSRLLAS